ncbi:hypothetical protein [Streptomyces kurssanovii]|uniref:HEAT repeat domain-containing protein n=1 Tax=Streptomyces kurssanovii TaxID=67312 RepID=A0ABV3HLQ2_9ACTN
MTTPAPSVCPLSPWEAPERIAAVARLAASAGPAALARDLLFASQDAGHGVAACLRAMPEERRRAVAALLTECAESPVPPPGLRRRALVLLAVVSRGFAPDEWYERWTALLEGWAQEWYWAGTSDELPAVAEAVLDAGRPLSDEVVGLLRRSAYMANEWAAVLLERTPLPLLDPGEPWADRIRAELPALGAPWPALVAHLLAAPAAPTKRWDREAADILRGIDPDTVRRTVTPWAELAAQGGGAEDGGYDPCDVTAIRGIARLLALLPPHPDSVLALAALVERPPVKAVVAGAAVRALAHLEGGAGRAELTRLADRVGHRGTLRQIRRALAS